MLPVQVSPEEWEALGVYIYTAAEVDEPENMGGDADSVVLSGEKS